VNTMVDQPAKLRLGSDARAREVAPRASWAARPWCRAWPAPGNDLTRQREIHGEQSDRPGAKHRRRDTAVAKGDLSRKITVGREGRNFGLKTPSTSWWTSCRRSPRK